MPVPNNHAGAVIISTLDRGAGTVDLGQCLDELQTQFGSKKGQKLAEVAVEAAALGSGPLLKDASFELYYTKGAQPCEGKFKKLLADEAFPRLHGDSYAALFKGVRRDGTYDVPA